METLDTKLPHRHPIRSHGMHGLINLFAAAAFAWHGETAPLEDILTDEDQRSFAEPVEGLRTLGYLP